MQATEATKFFRFSSTLFLIVKRRLFFLNIPTVFIPFTLRFMELKLSVSH